MMVRRWQRPHEQWRVRMTAVPKLWMVMEVMLEVVLEMGEGMMEQVTMLMGEVAVQGVMLMVG